MAERLYELTEKGKKLLKQLKYNKQERVNMVDMASSILLINHENKSSHNSSQDEKESK
jgi:DNA-binding PadR family transcriptional regulator